MGSDCRIITHGAPSGATDRARSLVDVLESRWSRFRDTSEISWLNESSGRPAVVSTSTLDLLRRAMYATHHTDGLFDPFMLEELEALGYDQSHAEPRNGLVEAAAAVVADQTRLVELPSGHRIDPGGVGKGYACDVVAQQLFDEGVDDAVVVMGGDLRIVAVDPGFVTEVEIQDPWDRDRVVGTIEVGPGAVATSSTLWRRWADSDGCERHHLLDPRTRRPASTDLVAATVVAGETWWAEALAKAVVIGGSDIGETMLDHHGVSALLTFADGQMRRVGPALSSTAA